MVNFTDVVALVVTLLAADARQRNLAPSFEPCDTEMAVHGDVVRLEQVVWNLPSNALKFTPEGDRIDVSLECRDGMACLEVGV